MLAADWPCLKLGCDDPDPVDTPDSELPASGGVKAEKHAWRVRIQPSRVHLGFFKLRCVVASGLFHGCLTLIHADRV